MLSTVDFSYIVKNYGTVADSSVNITESEMETYYSKHKDNFKRSALRDIEYVTYDVIASEEDVKDRELDQ